MTQYRKLRGRFAPASARLIRMASGQRRITAHTAVGGVVVAAVEAWFLGGPVDGRLMPVEMAANGSPPAVVRLPQTDFYLGASDVPTPAVEHVYILADRIDDLEVYRYEH